MLAAPVHKMMRDADKSDDPLVSKDEREPEDRRDPLQMIPTPPTYEELQAELASLHKAIAIINHLAGEVDIHTAMQNVRQVVLELLDCEKVTLYLVSERRQELRGLTIGPSGELVIKVRFGEGIAGTVAATGQLMNIEDTYSHPLFNSAIDRDTGYRTRNLLCCAIRDLSERNVAVLQALNKHGMRPFTAADENSINLFGTHLGNTLQKARMHEAAMREKKRLSALYQCFKDMAASGSLDQLLHLARAALHDVLHVERAFVFLYDAPREELWTTFHVPDQAQQGTARVCLGSGLVGGAAADRTVRVLGSEASPGQADTLRAIQRSSSVSSGPRSALAPPAGNISASFSMGVTVGADGTRGHGLTPSMARAMGAKSSGGRRPSSRGHDLIDESLLAQIRGALGDSPVMSVLVQPLVADDKLLGAVLVVNKRELGSHRDILFEDWFTESDVEAMALFALELASALSDRSLEIALASAMSVVWNRDHGSLPESAAGSTGGKGDESVESADEFMVRSQLISMYVPSTPDQRRLGSFVSQRSYHSLGMRVGTADRARWQHALTILGSANRSSKVGVHGLPGLLTSSGSLPPIHNLRHGSRSAGQLDIGGVAGLPLGVPMGGQRAGHIASHHSALPSSLRPADSAAETPRGDEALRGGDGAIHNLSSGPARGNPITGVGMRRASSCGAVDNVAALESAGLGPTMSAAQGADVRSWDGRSGGGGRRHRLSHVATNLLTAGQEEDAEEDGFPFLDDEGPQPLMSSFLSHPLNSQHILGPISAPAFALDSPRRTVPRGSSDGDAEHTIGSPSASSSPMQRGGLESERPADAPQSANGGRGVKPARTCTAASFFDAADIYSWNLDMLHLDRIEQVKLCHDLFVLSGLVEQLGLSRPRLRAFLMAVSGLYNDVPYHNFNHAVHVLHGAAMFLRAPSVRKALPPEECLALLIAALCHDLDHDGCTNGYHVNCQTELARIYNDISVMESHHCAMTFAVLARTDCAFLEGLEQLTQRRIRKAVIAAILSTDMTHHVTVTQEFKKHSPTYDPEVEADRLLLLKVLLHASDIGAGVRPFEINDAMTHRVHTEFQALAEKEVCLGLPITFAIDVSNRRMCAQVECNFMEFVVTPLWERLGEVFPELEPCYQQLMRNRELYKGLAVAPDAALGGAKPA